MLNDDDLEIAFNKGVYYEKKRILEILLRNSYISSDLIKQIEGDKQSPDNVS